MRGRGKKKRKGKRRQNISQWDVDRESLRWQDAVEITTEKLAGRTIPIHVMDREGDHYELMSHMNQEGIEFVTRLSHDRRLDSSRETTTEKLFQKLSSSQLQFTREVQLASRGAKNRTTTEVRTYPPRAARPAQLEIRAESQEIYIATGAVAHVPRSLRLNFVEAREVNIPEGEPGVLWRLVTTLPIENHQQIAQIIDIYRHRWLIEEFFKALKTGCRYESHQLESSHSLLVILSIEMGVAWQMLLLRWLCRTRPKAPATDVLRKTQIDALRFVSKNYGYSLREHPNASDVLMAVARLGGHIKNNGSPGWIILRRGFDKLETIEMTVIAMIDHQKM